MTTAYLYYYVGEVNIGQLLLALFMLAVFVTAGVILVWDFTRE